MFCFLFMVVVWFYCFVVILVGVVLLLFVWGFFIVWFVCAGLKCGFCVVVVYLLVSFCVCILMGVGCFLLVYVVCVFFGCLCVVFCFWLFWDWWVVGACFCLFCSHIVKPGLGSC